MYFNEVKSAPHSNLAKYLITFNTPLLFSTIPFTYSLRVNLELKINPKNRKLFMLSKFFPYKFNFLFSLIFFFEKIITLLFSTKNLKPHSAWSGVFFFLPVILPVFLPDLSCVCDHWLLFNKVCADWCCVGRVCSHRSHPVLRLMLM